MLSLRFATFNASLNRQATGQLIADFSTPNNLQAQAVAEIIQRVNPDVLLINEFDYDAGSIAARLFQQNYLAVEQAVSGSPSGRIVTYPYYYLAPCNTGIHSGFDLDKNGQIISTPEAPGYAEDAWGFGHFPGQFGLVLYSKYPILAVCARTFQHFLWQDMPEALIPEDWYETEVLARFPLSSKSHWDIPIDVSGTVIHCLASHPTPPVFDGSEKRNCRRNHDEIRFWADYITPSRGDYLYDDGGKVGGLLPGSRFVILGDQNADAWGGDSWPGAIRQLLGQPAINNSVTPSSEGAVEDARFQKQANDRYRGNPAFATARFNPIHPGNLRVDYVLPCHHFPILKAGVFWPTINSPLLPLVKHNLSSDHRLVFADLGIVDS